MPPRQPGASTWPFVVGLLLLVPLAVLWWTRRGERPTPRPPPSELAPFFDESRAVDIREFPYRLPGVGGPGLVVAYAERRTRTLPADAGWLSRLEALDEGESLLVRMNLLPQAEFDMRVERMPAAGAGNRAWRGTGVGNVSRLVLVASPVGPAGPGSPSSGTYYLGMLRTGREVAYRMQRYPGALDFLIEELKEPPEQRCDVQVEDQVTDQDRSAEPVRVVPSEITVLACYTRLAATGGRSGLGESDLVWGTIQLGIAQTMQAFKQSGIVHRLRLVAPEDVAELQIDDDEAGGLEAVLTRMERGAGPGMRRLRGLREKYAADLVVLVVKNAGCDSCCGRARVMINPSQDFAEHAFSVVPYGCMGHGSYSFTHELAHNFGCCHDPRHLDGGCTGPAPHDLRAHGHVLRFGNQAAGCDERYLTLMTERDPPSAIPAGCLDIQLRIPWFSNPSVSYTPDPRFPALPTGVRGQADNAAIINENGYLLSRFRSKP